MASIFTMLSMDMKRFIIEQKFPNKYVLLIEEELLDSPALEKLVLLRIIDENMKDSLVNEELDPAFEDITAIVLDKEEMLKLRGQYLGPYVNLWSPSEKKWL